MAKLFTIKAKAKPKAEKTVDAKPLIKTLSEVQAMTLEQKEKFRQDGGTTTQG